MNNKIVPSGTQLNYPGVSARPQHFSPLSRLILKSNVEELVDEMFTNLFGNTQSMKDKLVAKGKFPKTDIFTKEDSSGNKTLVFEMAVPGIEPKEIDINASFEEGTISVSFEKKENQQSEAKNYISRELSHSSFLRSWSIPKDLIRFKTEEDIAISLINGILKIELRYICEKPELEPEKPKVTRLKIQ